MSNRTFEAKPDHPAVGTLVHLHADLGARIQANKQQGEELADDMRAVEVVIRLFDPEYDLRSITARRRVTGNPWYRRGECFRHALDVLRDSDKPLTARELVRVMLAKRGVSEPTGKEVRQMVAAVQRSLMGHKGKSAATVGEGIPARWAIIRS